MELQPEEFTDEPYLANVEPLSPIHETVPTRRNNRRRRRRQSSWLRSMESLLDEYWTNANPWATRLISNSLEIKLELPMETTSLLLLISDLPHDKPVHTPEINENMVTVDHNLSGGVISSLHPKNGDAVKGITPASTKENPYKTTCEQVDSQEVYPKNLPSAIFLETTPTDNPDLPSVNEEELLISTVDHSSP